MQNNPAANRIIAEIIGRGIDWFDYNALPFAEKKAYWLNAQIIIKNNVFQNEIKHFVADLVQEIAKKAPDMDTVLALRAMINALEAFKERLGEITDPEIQENKDNLNESI